MKVKGDPRFTPTVEQDIENIAVVLGRAKYRNDKRPRAVTVGTKVGYKYNGVWVESRNGVLGMAWWQRRGGVDYIDMVTSPAGALNKTHRHDFLHELTHAVLYANGYMFVDHHAIMKKARLF